MNDRIGSDCWYQKYDYEKRVASWHAGRLLSWSTDHVEGNDGSFGHFPAAVVEDIGTGMCHSVRVDLICFAAAPPTIKPAN